MKRVLLLIGIMFSLIPAFAEDNVLQTIEIVPVKDTYNIVLISDKAVDVKKSVQAPNRITLTMKDIRASKTLNTVYNNVSNVDTLMVEPQGNGLTIFFQAENASNASVTFDSLAAPVAITPAKTTKKLKLNNPIESYAPIYSEDLKSAKTSGLFDRLKSNQTMDGIKDSLEESSASDTANKFISFGLITLLFVAVVKLFKRKQPDMKIGLTQSLNNNEIGLYKNNSLFQQGYQTLEKPFTTVNYGINAYKNESKNPYETAPVEFHNPRLKTFAQPHVSTQMQTAIAQQATVNSTTAAQTKKMTTPVNTAPVNQTNPNIDNIRFLESMTAIYEKSGRHDLARGLKANLSKNNIR